MLTFPYHFILLSLIIAIFVNLCDSVRDHLLASLWWIWAYALCYEVFRHLLRKLGEDLFGQTGSDPVNVPRISEVPVGNELDNVPLSVSLKVGGVERMLMPMDPVHLAKVGCSHSNNDDTHW